MEDSTIACLCNNVTYGAIQKAVENGAASFEEVCSVAGFGRSCGMCTAKIRPYVQALLRERGNRKNRQREEERSEDENLG